MCDLGNCKVYFQQNEDGPYDVIVSNNREIEKIYQHLSLLDEDYRRLVQAATYEKVKNKISEYKLTIENEEILEDNSVLITLNIMGTSNNPISDGQTVCEH